MAKCIGVNWLVFIQQFGIHSWENGINFRGGIVVHSWLILLVFIPTHASANVFLFVTVEYFILQ